MKIKSILLALVIAVGGCCTARDENGVSFESYRAALTKVRSNIAEIRSDVITVEYDATIKEADIQLIDATITLCDDTLADKNAGAAPTVEGGQ